MVGSRPDRQVAKGHIVDGFDFDLFHGNRGKVACLHVEQIFVAFEVGSSFISARHGHVDIFEDLARSDAENAFGGFDEVVSLAAAVLAAEVIGEAESVIEFLGSDQEAGAVSLPFDRFHGAPIPVLPFVYPVTRFGCSTFLNRVGTSSFFV